MLIPSEDVGSAIQKIQVAVISLGRPTICWGAHTPWKHKKKHADLPLIYDKKNITWISGLETPCNIQKPCEPWRFCLTHIYCNLVSSCFFCSFVRSFLGWQPPKKHTKHNLTVVLRHTKSMGDCCPVQLWSTVGWFAMALLDSTCWADQTASDMPGTDERIFGWL